jgi:hypothetical protein
MGAKNARIQPAGVQNAIKMDTKSNKTFRNPQQMIEIGKIHTQIKQNVILECFLGSWGAGSAKGCPQPLGGLHIFQLCCRNVQPNC